MPKGKQGFQKGNELGQGGAREGAGRPADWLREKCQAIIEKHDLIGFLGKVAAGENVEQIVNDQGEILSVPAAIKERHKAIEMLLDRGYGKPGQSIEVSNPDGSAVSAVPTQALAGLIDLFRQRALKDVRGGAGKEEGK